MSIESLVMPYDFSELEPAMSRDCVVFHFYWRSLRPAGEQRPGLS